MLFSQPISADTILGNCNDRYVKEEPSKYSESVKGYLCCQNYYLTLFVDHKSKRSNSLALYERLIESLHLNSLMPQDMQFSNSFFKSFLQSYPTILVNLKDQNLIDDFRQISFNLCRRLKMRVLGFN